MQGQNEESQRSLNDIDPTVVIGLGGAGGQVLARVRRIFTEEFANELEPNGPSPLQFLLLDTDDFDKLPNEVKACLPDRHRDFLSLSHFNPVRYATRQLVIPGSDLRRWFDQRALRYLEDGMIRDGASRQRMLGRLCLHYSFREVEQRIRNKIDAAADARLVANSRRVRPEPRPLHIFIVASSCGGTGSASFLDIACLVQRIARDRGTTPSVTGFLFLPFKYIEANTDLDPALESFYQHNAWAFFDELNHFLLHPERVPEFVLDLDRPDGHPPRPFDYGREIFRTIYLLNDRIPQVGRLDFPQMYAYAARGIFDLFLAPEEGAVQSHYSNIKDKLKEPDRIYGLVKRFATFGYAEYRLHDNRLAQHLAEKAVECVWAELTGAEPDTAAVAAEVAKLESVVAQEVQSVIDEAGKWGPAFEPGAELVRGGREKLLGEVPTAVAVVQQQLIRDLEKKRESADALRQALWRIIDKLLEGRIDEWPKNGVGREQEIWKRFRAALQTRAEALAPADEIATAPLDADSALARARQQLTDSIQRLGKKRDGFPFFLDAPDAVTPGVLATEIDGFFEEVRKAARERHKSEMARRLSRALRGIVADGGPLAGRIQALDPIIDSLARPVGGGAAEEVGAEPVPTAREYPPADEVQQEVIDRLKEVRTKVQKVVGLAQRNLWIAYRIDSSRHTQSGAGAFRRLLVDLWAEEIEKLTELGSTREVRDPLAAGEGCGDNGYLRDLLPMSSPACPIERTGLHPLDSIPQIPAVIWGWKNFKGKEQAILDCLGITQQVTPAPCGNRKRVAILQAWYGFTSRALEGMETLRGSYLRRDREISLPHIHAEWNEHGVGCTGDSLAILSDADLLHVARILALSHAAVDPAKGAAFPGIEVVVDPRDPKKHAGLLRYEQNECALALVWRRIRPRPGYHWKWDVEYAVPGADGACAEAAGGKVFLAGVDLALDLATYLASDARAEHARLLAEITCLERIGEDPPTWYGAAYRSYLNELNERISRERDRRRNRHIPVLNRLSDVLHRYLHGTANDEVISL